MKIVILNGNCPYSVSKAVCEMISSSYYNISKNMIVRTVRGGNVIGGGDWSKNRIIPDLVKSFINQSTYSKKPKIISGHGHMF